MPALKHQIAPEPQAEPAMPPATAMPAEIVSMGGTVAYAESPARLLHERLAGHFEATVVAPEERWSGTARVGFILGASLGLWALIGGITVALIA